MRCLSATAFWIVAGTFLICGLLSSVPAVPRTLQIELPQNLDGHANLLVDRTQSQRHEEKSPGSGFTGMELQVESEAFDPDGHFLFWKPGSSPIVEPPGLALRLDPGNDLVLKTHLQPSGKPESVQPTIGIYFTNWPATKFPLLLQLENDRALDIPPGERDFLVSDQFTLPEDVDLLAIYPHAHYLCRDMLALARFSDGTEKTLIHIPRWDLNWQAVFRLAQPEPLLLRAQRL
jgi:hypothetical protein